VRPEYLPGATAPEITIDAEGVGSLEQSILRAFAYWQNHVDLRETGFGEVLAALRRIHNNAFAGFRNLSLEIMEHHNEFDRLTGAQLGVLDAVSENRRLLVRGCAGSGKTFLAKRLAEKRSTAGERVAVLCFNNLLGKELEEELGGLPNVRATNFHRFCEQILECAGVRLPPPTPGEESAYYESLLDSALSALEAYPDLRFDCVIVDEAQDFEQHWWVVVEALLTGEGASLTVLTDTSALGHRPGRRSADVDQSRIARGAGRSAGEDTLPASER
jgi:hypothetical protein